MPPDVGPTPRDPQQAEVLRILSRRAGHPVTYDEIQSAGIEFPAGVVAELELAGVEIERCRAIGSGGRPVMAVRLPATAREIVAHPAGAGDPVADSQASSKPPWDITSAYRKQAPTRRTAGRKRKRATARLLAPLALLVMAGAIAAVLVGDLSGGNAHPKLSAADHHPRSATVAKAGRSRSRPKPSRTTAVQHNTTTATSRFPRLPATSISPPLATALEARGHDVLASGQYTAAVPILERAVAATGEHVTACVEPTTDACLTYAFALFDLGRALLLSGRPAAAAAVLERRLQIDNQRPVVAAQLARARQG